MFVRHMLWHMLLVAAIAPAAAMALRGTRSDPARLMRGPLAPLLACLIEFIVIWAWHLPVLHQAAREHGMVLVMEQASMFGAALALWSAILGGTAAERRGRAAAGVIALVVTFAHMTMLGAVIALSPRELYGHHALDGQQLGGALMILAGTVVYPLAAIWLARGLVAVERRA